MVSGTLLTIHNLHFYLGLMAQARAHIEAGDYAPWHASWIARCERSCRQLYTWCRISQIDAKNYTARRPRPLWSVAPRLVRGSAAGEQELPLRGDLGIEGLDLGRGERMPCTMRKCFLVVQAHHALITVEATLQMDCWGCMAGVANWVRIGTSAADCSAVSAEVETGPAAGDSLCSAPEWSVRTAETDCSSTRPGGRVIWPSTDCLALRHRGVESPSGPTSGRSPWS